MTVRQYDSARKSQRVSAVPIVIGHDHSVSAGRAGSPADASDSTCVVIGIATARLTSYRSTREPTCVVVGIPYTPLRCRLRCQTIKTVENRCDRPGCGIDNTPQPVAAVVSVVDCTFVDRARLCSEANERAAVDPVGVIGGDFTAPVGEACQIGELVEVVILLPSKLIGARLEMIEGIVGVGGLIVCTLLSRILNRLQVPVQVIAEGCDSLEGVYDLSDLIEIVKLKFGCLPQRVTLLCDPSGAVVKKSGCISQRGRWPIQAFFLA